MLGIAPLGGRLGVPGEELVPVGGQDELVAASQWLRVGAEEYHAHLADP